MTRQTFTMASKTANAMTERCIRRNRSRFQHPRITAFAPMMLLQTLLLLSHMRCIQGRHAFPNMHRTHERWHIDENDATTERFHSHSQSRQRQDYYVEKESNASRQLKSDSSNYRLRSNDDVQITIGIANVGKGREEETANGKGKGKGKGKGSQDSSSLTDSSSSPRPKAGGVISRPSKGGKSGTSPSSLLSPSSSGSQSKGSKSSRTPSQSSPTKSDKSSVKTGKSRTSKMNSNSFKTDPPTMIVMMPTMSSSGDGGTRPPIIFSPKPTPSMPQPTMVPQQPSQSPMSPTTQTPVTQSPVATTSPNLQPTTPSPNAMQPTISPTTPTDAPTQSPDVGTPTTTAPNIPPTVTMMPASTPTFAPGTRCAVGDDGSFGSQEGASLVTDFAYETTVTPSVTVEMLNDDILGDVEDLMAGFILEELFTECDNEGVRSIFDVQISPTQRRPRQHSNTGSRQLQADKLDGWNTMPQDTVIDGVECSTQSNFPCFVIRGRVTSYSDGAIDPTLDEDVRNAVRMAFDDGDLQTVNAGLLDVSYRDTDLFPIPGEDSSPAPTMTAAPTSAPTRPPSDPTIRTSGTDDGPALEPWMIALISIAGAFVLCLGYLCVRTPSHRILTASDDEDDGSSSGSSDDSSNSGSRQSQENEFEPPRMPIFRPPITRPEEGNNGESNNDEGSNNDNDGDRGDDDSNNGNDNNGDDNVQNDPQDGFADNGNNNIMIALSTETEDDPSSSSSSSSSSGDGEPEDDDNDNTYSNIDDAFGLHQATSTRSMDAEGKYFSDHGDQGENESTLTPAEAFGEAFSDKQSVEAPAMVQSFGGDSSSGSGSSFGSRSRSSRSSGSGSRSRSSRSSSMSGSRSGSGSYSSGSRSGSHSGSHSGSRSGTYGSSVSMSLNKEKQDGPSPLAAAADTESAGSFDSSDAGRPAGSAGPPVVTAEGSISLRDEQVSLTLDDNQREEPSQLSFSAFDSPRPQMAELLANSSGSSSKEPETSYSEETASSGEYDDEYEIEYVEDEIEEVEDEEEETEEVFWDEHVEELNDNGGGDGGDQQDGPNMPWMQTNRSAGSL